VSTVALLSFDDVVERFEPVIGLETHVELGTRTKMFCGCPTVFGAPPNTQICPVCLGLPGSLPVANKAAIEATIRIGLALNCTIATWCRFARKNYFYPDMPKNFQISQYDEPLCVDGWLDILVDGEIVRIGIERVHLEEDTGKTLHVGGATGRIHGATESLVDYNRAGIPLVEIVTKPVPGTGSKAPEVAKAYVTELREVVRSLGVSDVRMEQGSMRCDVNTSLNLPGEPWGTRTETKNVNSLRSVERAVRSEIIRQGNILESGGRIIQETRHFHEETGDTTAGRGLPLLPRARPGAARAGPGLGGQAQGRAARVAPRAPRAAAAGVGTVRSGHAVGGQRRCGRADRADRRVWSVGRDGAQVVAR
jgi:aspartyl-tRNA(Asn)/glutamyl-tRNA(Gln) amidotransferase subunit B